MRIKKSTDIGERDSIVLVAKRDSSFDSIIKTKQEKDFLAFNLKNENKQFIFNQFPRWIFVLLIDEGKDTPTSLEESRKEANNISGLINSRKIKSVTVTGSEDVCDHVLASAEALALGSYQFTKYANKKREKLTLLKQ